MSPELLAVIKDISLDAIKILGPAIITAIISYKWGKLQVTLKLKAMDKTHEFGAREHLFNYYKERSKSLLERQGQLNASLGKLIGIASGVTAVAKEEASEFLKTMGEMIRDLSRTDKMELYITKKDMKKNKLNEIPEFNEIDLYVKEVENLSQDNTLPALRKNITTLLEINTHLYYCQQLMLEKTGGEIFKKYLD